MTRRARALLLWGLVAVALLAAAGLGGGWLILRQYMAEQGPLRAETVVYLPRGSGLVEVADRLAAAAVIDHPLLFVTGTRLAGRDRLLKAGEYRFTPGMSPEAVLALLESGRTVLHRITIPPGITVHEAMAILGSAEALEGELPPPPPEGRILPDTWLVPRDEPRRRLLERMTDEMDQALREAWAKRQPDLPLRGPDQALILASLIEKETAVPEEYPLVAAVLLNRLRRGMRLQTDPTVIYALTGGKGSLGRPLLRSDLEIDDPYNTYRIEGLPPGPICNPGRRALEAAVQPADVDYLFFVADGTGGHAFAKTLTEHNRNVARWRKARDAGRPAAPPVSPAAPSAAPEPSPTVTPDPSPAEAKPPG